MSVVLENPAAMPGPPFLVSHRTVLAAVACISRPRTDHPLPTLCTGTMQLIQEILASHIARVPTKPVPKDAPLYSHALAAAKIDSKAVKMALYGAFVSAPLGHYLVGLLQRAFAGRTSTRDKILQIVASNLIVSPIQISSECCMVFLKDRKGCLASLQRRADGDVTFALPSFSVPCVDGGHQRGEVCSGGDQDRQGQLLLHYKGQLSLFCT